MVHKPDLRDPHQIVKENEIEINVKWKIVIGETASQYMLQLAQDLQDYFLTSMNLSLQICSVESIASAINSDKHLIILSNKSELPQFGTELSVTRSYRLDVMDD